jgi:hypothetical protein
MAIVNSAIGATDTTVLTVPSGKRYAITTILVCNTHVPETFDTDEGLTVFDMHLVPSGQPKGDVNKVVNSLYMPAGETFVFDSEKIILEAGDSIIILGESPTNLNATVSYLEV